MKEVKLPFGNVSNTVQIGDTVHRDTGPWTPTIHALLAYLHDNDFIEAPQVLGFDDKGREILTFLPGVGAARPWPSVLHSQAGLEQAARLLCKYHDLVEKFQPLDDAEWRMGKIDLKPGQVIRHGDLGPWNTLWQGDKLTGLIDWDFAQPGDRIEDLAQMAYYFIPLRGEEGWKNAGFKERPNFAERLKTLVTAYGMYSPEEVIKAVFVNQEDDRKRTKEKGEQGVEPWVRFIKRGDIEESLRDMEWLESVKAELLA